ncbi:DNA double-strand break repair nuclease NurA [Clostridium sp. D2Q-11]|uniref:DNA double-strand break repair nuclease NurA n=1 Tax=Anaeromonas frigoriresistens TaxID=2683708 RepID=A0A942Z8F2_9FIRM|nr:DNA double-strand break repair nuclease NurA [Anaeromonas frigoriresistens]MBS4537924.1 DNA double-strand break repair nuclease NurA [Anaeromonas frigoriresistens]
MLEVNKDMKNLVSELNEILSEKYEKVSKLDKKYIRQLVHKEVGNINKCRKLSKGVLAEYATGGGIVAVDGSNNKFGGAYPHFVELYQGLARGSKENENPIVEVDFYTPLYIEREQEIIDKLDKGDSNKGKPTKSEVDTFIRNYKLSCIELKAAIRAALELNPKIIMMDGSLIRYKIECQDKWRELKSVCEEKNIILIGVVKDIKTNIVGTTLAEKKSLEPPMNFLYDRELLYGILEMGETLIPEIQNIPKYEEGLSSLFIRSSRSPMITGVDILNSQRSYLKEMANLVYTLTPENSRGIPLWIDIIDKEVRISDKLMRGLLDRYLDRDILEKLFVSERSKRTL